MTKKKIMISCITILIIATLMLVGLAYAYYRTRIIGNPINDSINVVTTNKLEVIYQNESAIIVANEIEPGYSATKTFEVKNNGDEKVNYSIMFDNVENTFKRVNDWTFTLKEGETILKSGIVPQTESYIEYSEEIAVGETKSYTLEINYANATEDQSVDMGSSLSLRININEEVGEIFNKAKTNTLLKAIGRDNIISEPLTVPGKEPSKTSIYDDGNLSLNTFTTSISSPTKDRYWVYATGYNFDEETGKYTLTGVKIGQYKNIYEELNDKYILSDPYFSNSSSTEEGAAKLNTSNLSTIYKVVSADLSSLTYKEKHTNGLFGEAILASALDDYGISYYYRGIVENNYVTYSGMCWRIVRVQGDGSIKLTLADRDNECGTVNGYTKENEDSAFLVSPTLQKFKYVGEYGESDIKDILNAWAGISSDRTYKYYLYYNDLYEDAPDGMIFETTDTFTNPGLDITKLTEITPSISWCEDSSYRYISSEDPEYAIIYYAAYDRITGISTPTLKCDMEQATRYNEYAIGILSADEIALAGGTYSETSNFYLKINANWGWWTMSPGMRNWTGYSVIVLEDNGKLGLRSPVDSLDYYSIEAIRPAVILKPDVSILSGNGTIDNPYIIN